MKTLMLLAGLPGVGKSTISRHLREKIKDARVIDIDVFKAMIVDPTLIGDQVDPPEIRWACYQLALNTAFGLFEYGLTSTVIMDEVFHLASLRCKVEKLCAERGVNVLWVEVRSPHHVVKERLQQRKGHILSPEEALNIHQMFREIFEKFPDAHPGYIAVENDGRDVGTLVDDIMEKRAV